MADNLILRIFFLIISNSGSQSSLKQSFEINLSWGCVVERFGNDDIHISYPHNNIQTLQIQFSLHFFLSGISIRWKFEPFGRRWNLFLASEFMFSYLKKNSLWSDLPWFLTTYSHYCIYQITIGRKIFLNHF